MMNRLFLGLAALLVVLLGVSVWKELRPPWRSHQVEYAGLAGLESPEIGLRQVWIPELGLVDRCTSCHLGVENESMAQAPEPYRTHPGEHLKIHPPEKFGCTPCHGGQGVATRLPDAHGRVRHWEEPLLDGELLFTACGRCHYENELYDPGSVAADIYGRESYDRPIGKAELETTLAGTGAVARGKALMVGAGCLGCHRYRGKGGLQGPDITFVGDKNAHDFDFTRVQGPHTVEEWLFEHFRKPGEVSPGTVMPDLRLSDEEARDLTALMLNFRRKSVPASYTPLPQSAGGEPAGGASLYTLFCSSCHGRRGEGSEVPGIVAPSLHNRDTLAVAGDDFLRSTVAHGRPGTRMSRWDGQGGGLLPEEIGRIVAHLRSWDPTPPDPGRIRAAAGNADRGTELYLNHCAGCHGPNGEGGIGTALNNPVTLSVASDAFLRDAILFGRENTAMPSWKHLTAPEVSDLLALLRRWSGPRAARDEVLALQGDVAAGRRLYDLQCASCHGPGGEGGVGTTLGNQPFLARASRGFLAESILQGRPGTAMPSWSHLAAQEVADLVALIKGRQTVPDATEEEVSLEGADVTRGTWLYGQSCSGCHGTVGEGGGAPQLANPAFLAAASDAYLFGAIAYGREGTLMNPYLAGVEWAAEEFSRQQVLDIVAHIRSWQQAPPSTLSPEPVLSERAVAAGAVTYEQACARCHGDQGQGASGPALRNASFLRTASDGFLTATIIVGRAGTEMPAMANGPPGPVTLPITDIRNVVAFLRSWEDQPGLALPNRPVEGNAGRGAALYETHCATCHGAQGEGGKGEGGEGPALNNPGFLDAATDGFLMATIVRGRRETRMPSFGLGGDGPVQLTMPEIRDLVAFIRGWAEP